MKSNTPTLLASLVTTALFLSTTSKPIGETSAKCDEALPNYPYFQSNTTVTNACSKTESKLRYDFAVGTKPVANEAYQGVINDLIDDTTQYLKLNPPGPDRDTVYTTGRCSPVDPQNPLDEACEKKVCVDFATRDSDDVDFHIEEELEVLNFLKAIPASNQPLNSTLLVKGTDGRALANACIQLSPVCGTGQDVECPAPV